MDSAKFVDIEEVAVLPGMELMGCQNLAVPAEVMHHVVRVESSYNPYAIGVVGGRLARQPGNLPEAVATARMLESKGYNFSLGLAQVNRYNLDKYGLGTYEQAFGVCPNLQAGARILAECHGRSGGDWGKSLSCYYSGNFVTGYRHGYVQKVYASMGVAAPANKAAVPAIEVIDRRARRVAAASRRNDAPTGRPVNPRIIETAAVVQPPSLQNQVLQPVLQAPQATLSAQPVVQVHDSAGLASPQVRSTQLNAANAIARQEGSESAADEAFVF